MVPGTMGCISIHAPVKGATRQRVDTGPCSAISIHAPVKGATSPVPYARRRNFISIHAPVKGATITTTQFDREFAFQSTLP